MVCAYTCVSDAARVKRLIVTTSIAASVFAVSGCAIGSNSIDNAVPTSAISIADNAPSIAPDPFVKRDTQIDGAQTDRLLDEDTIRLAVTTADIGKLNGQVLAWANESTGSSGEITNIVQRMEAGQTCRSFKATRQAYDGATLYEGDVCLDRASGWWTRLLRPFSRS